MAVDAARQKEAIARQEAANGQRILKEAASSMQAQWEAAPAEFNRAKAAALAERSSEFQEAETFRSTNTLLSARRESL